jgi:excisionase family DNA binding protein
MSSPKTQTVRVPIGRHHSDGPGLFEPLLDVGQAAALLRVHPKTAQKWAREGKIPAIHYGHRWLFRASELDSWVASQVHSPCHACRPSEEIR